MKTIEYKIIKPWISPCTTSLDTSWMSWMLFILETSQLCGLSLQYTIKYFHFQWYAGTEFWLYRAWQVRRQQSVEVYVISQDSLECSRRTHFLYDRSAWSGKQTSKPPKQRDNNRGSSPLHWTRKKKKKKPLKRDALVQREQVFGIPWT